MKNSEIAAQISFETFFIYTAEVIGQNKEKAPAEFMKLIKKAFICKDKLGNNNSNNVSCVLYCIST